MKKLFSLILSVILLFGLCSCSDADSKKDEKADAESQEHPAVLVIKKYVKALVEYDVETQKKCLDPSVNSFSNALVDTVGGFLNISDASGMADGAAGMLGSAFEMSTDINVDCKFVEVINNNLSEKNGDITVQYKLIITDNNSDEEYETEFLWRFYMVCKDSKWYILSYDELGEESDETSDETLDTTEDGNSVNVNTVGSKATRYKNAKHFSGGYAVVDLYDDYYDRTEKYACIDTKGIIRAVYPEGYEHYAPSYYSFYNGVCLLENDDQGYKVMTSTGKELYSTDTGSIEALSETGFTVIEETEESYYGTTYKNGLLDNKGNWVFELSEKYSISYQDNGVFMVEETSDDNQVTVFYYDSATGERMETYENQYRYECYANGRLVDVSNGFTAIKDEQGNMVCEPIKGTYTDHCKENMKFSNCVSIENESTVYYYDLDGNLLFKTEENVDIYSDGLLLVWNGSKYIDKNGNVIIKTDVYD